MMNHRELRSLLARGLADDGYALDWTTIGTLGVAARTKKKSAKIIAKADGFFFGAELARAAEAESEATGYPFSAKILVEDGARVRAGQNLIEWKGSAAGILLLERPYLNLASYLSGIATRTRALTDLVAAEWKRKSFPGSPPRVTCTRKILPYYRDAAIAAVIAGGGHPHRVNLSGGVLIKENHIASAGGIVRAIAGVREAAPHGLKIEIEIRNLTELRTALSARADVIMLDNFSPEQTKVALEVIAKADFAPIVESSGGISEATIAKYAQPGVHILSVGSLTHSVTALDLSLLIQ